MLIRGLTVEEVCEALEESSEKYVGGNLKFRHEPEEVKGWVKCQIKCKRARLLDGTPAPGAKVYRVYSHLTLWDGRIPYEERSRVSTNATWDAHGYFMACIYKRNPEARIKTGHLVHGSFYIKNEDEMIEHWPKAYSVLDDD